MFRVIRICRKCGAKIFSDAPEGLCAKCVLKTALMMPPDAPVAARDDGGPAANVEAIAAAADAAFAMGRPLDNASATIPYRKRMVRVFAQRVLEDIAASD